MAVAFWDNDDPEEAAEWDRCNLGGELLPGVATVKCPTSRSVDGKAVPGKDGATFKDKGRDLAKVTISLHITTSEEFLRWQAMRPKLEPQKLGGLKSPLAIEHPKTELAGVPSVYVTGIEESDPNARDGMTVTIQCIEYRKAPKATKQGTKTVEEPAKSTAWRYGDDISKLVTADTGYTPAFRYTDTGPDVAPNSFYDIPKS